MMLQHALELAGLLFLNIGGGGGSAPESGPLKQLAAYLWQGGLPMFNSLQTGKLPAGAEAFVEQGEQANLAATKQSFDSLGLGKSTMATQGADAVRTAAAAQRFQIAQQVSLEGLQALEASGGLYTSLAQEYLQQEQQSASIFGGFGQMLGLLGSGSGGGFLGDILGLAGGVTPANYNISNQL